MGPQHQHGRQAATVSNPACGNDGGGGNRVNHGRNERQRGPGTHVCARFGGFGDDEIGTGLAGNAGLLHVLDLADPLASSSLNRLGVGTRVAEKRA